MDGPTLKVEIPLFDDAALQRSIQHPELKEMVQCHKAQGRRHIALQRELLNILQHSHRELLAEKQKDHERLENEKREKVI
jgi:hypothetical protein